MRVMVVPKRRKSMPFFRSRIIEHSASASGLVDSTFSHTSFLVSAFQGRER
jgi:hypothetical protein